MQLEDFTDDLLRCVLMEPAKNPNGGLPWATPMRVRRGMLAEPIRATCKRLWRLVPPPEGRCSGEKARKMGLLAEGLEHLQWFTRPGNPFPYKLLRFPALAIEQFLLWSNRRDRKEHDIDGWAKTYAKAAGLGQDQLMAWAASCRRWKFYGELEMKRDAAQKAAKHGHVQIFTDLRRDDPTTPYWKYLDAALHGGSLPLLRVAFLEFPRLTPHNMHESLKFAAHRGESEMLHWMLTERSCVPQGPLACRSRLSTLRVFVEHGLAIHSVSYALAVRAEDPVNEVLAGLDYMHDTAKVAMGSDIYRTVASTDFVNSDPEPILDWYAAHGGHVDPSVDYARTIMQWDEQPPHTWDSVVRAVGWFSMHGTVKTANAVQGAVRAGMPLPALQTILEMGWPEPKQFEVSLLTDPTVLDWIATTRRTIDPHSLMWTLYEYSPVRFPPALRKVRGDAEKTKVYRDFADKLLQLGCDWPADFMRKLVVDDRLEVMKWARSRGCPWDASIKSLASTPLGYRTSIWRWLESYECQRLYPETGSWRPWISPRRTLFWIVLLCTAAFAILSYLHLGYFSIRVIYDVLKLVNVATYVAEVFVELTLPGYGYHALFAIGMFRSVVYQFLETWRGVTWDGMDGMDGHSYVEATCIANVPSALGLLLCNYHPALYLGWLLVYMFNGQVNKYLRRHI